MEEKIELTQFEYDYLMAEKEVDTQILHMDNMIKRGYFKSLSKYFCDSVYGKFIPIGVIRDLNNNFVINGVRPFSEYDE